MPQEPSDLTHLYQGHHSWLLGWLRQRMESRENAEDLSHDTFLRVLGRQPSGEINEPRAYLASIARGLLIDHYRRASLERAYLEALATMPEPEAPSPEERQALLETLIEIDNLLDGLRPKVRQAFLLSQLDGLTYPQIAERMGLSVSSIQQYMGLALRHCYLARFT
ncbi:sigma-70 family RNA polymerase sigma factor [Pseudomonas sp. ABC1]|uniref:sigma-70 family RNA polymerase sigma factor n=1 Tax=Pseudomonas sp. ABC1 TaxID=2748080 RepID=UPI0015C38E5E|nr:sigma-70 family RNA polymerase sigma factor [Pseudomonas sp. ABC1]QLF92865.1 sigma-70 family RNA polymerase sigma factor [Pseudomonas sp. ABC1]